MSAQIAVGSSAICQSCGQQYLADAAATSKPIRVDFIGSALKSRVVVTCQDGAAVPISPELFSPKVTDSIEICRGVHLSILDGATRIAYGQANVLLLENNSAAQEANLIKALPDLRVDVLRAAGEGDDQLNTDELLNSLRPSYVVVTADTSHFTQSDKPGIRALERLSEALFKRQIPLMQTQALGCERGKQDECVWKDILVHENLLFTSEGDVAFRIRPSGVELIEEAPAPPQNVDCRRDTGSSGRQIKLSRFARHTGILIPRAELEKLDLPASLIPGQQPWIDVSWGDEMLFLGSEEQNTIQNFIAAGWMNRPAAVRLIASDATEASGYMNVKLDDLGYASLLAFVKASIQRASDGKVVDRSSFAAAPLHADDTIFLAASDIVPIPRSCNRWTAIALSQAGCETWPAITLTNSQLWETMARLRR